MHHPSSVTSSCAGRAAHLAQPRRDLVAHVVLEAQVGVLLVGHAPVEQEDVVALVEQELDERVARAQVEDVGAVDEREHEQDGHRRTCAWSSGSGRASSCGASRPRPWASSRSARRARSGRCWRTRARRSASGPCARGRSSRRAAPAARWLRGPPPWRRRGLGAVVARARRPARAGARPPAAPCSSLSSVRASCCAQARDVAAAGQAQVAHTRSRRRSRCLVSATTFSVAIASSSPNESRETTRSAALRHARLRPPRTGGEPPARVSDGLRSSLQAYARCAI